MKRIFFSILTLTLLLSACGSTSQATPIPTGTPTLVPTETATPTPTLIPTPTLPAGYPAEGYGPSNFPSDVDPLTGLKADNPALLERRPIVVKVSNLPRDVRPQWGLSLADIVYEYYTEEGTTRFAAVFYSKDAAQVGDIRSGRFFDENLIRMYKALFAFGSADYRVRNRLSSTEFANRLIYEWQAGCPAMCRLQADGYNYLVGNTAELSAYANKIGLANGRQDLDGMSFKWQVPSEGTPVEHIFTRFSSVIYNRWDYDPSSGRYLRFSDTQNDTNNGRDEVYAQLTDRLNGQPIATDNLVVLLMPHQFYSVSPEIVEMSFENSGVAYAFRDGQAYQLTWQRPTPDSVVYLAYADGSPFPFKPGTTWFEVMGQTSQLTQNEQGWRFVLTFP
jgi:hypothetical protein